MRIAFLTHEPFHPPSGGGSAAAGYLVAELVRRGHAVEVFAPQTGDLAPLEAHWGIRFHPFTRWPMGRTTPLRTAKYLAYPFALARQVAAHVRGGAHFDVCLAQHSISAVAAGRLKRQFGIPVVLNLLDCLTGFMETWPAWQMPRAAARRLVRYELSLPKRTHADAVLTVSDALRDRVIAGGYPADRTLAVYYGYDAALFRHTPTLPAAAGTPLVVMHGSFDRHHLGPIAREAVATIARARPEVRFRFTGPRTAALGSLLETVRGQVPGLRAEEDGFVPYERIPARLAEAWVGITPYEPSSGTHCAFVAKTVEYLALGLPVVCTPLESACRYYAGLAGIRFTPANGAGFGETVLSWLECSHEERAAAVEPARQKVARELDWPILCGRAADFIEATVTATRGPQPGPDSRIPSGSR